MGETGVGFVCRNEISSNDTLELYQTTETKHKRKTGRRNAIGTKEGIKVVILEGQIVFLEGRLLFGVSDRRRVPISVVAKFLESRGKECK